MFLKVKNCHGALQQITGCKDLFPAGLYDLLFYTSLMTIWPSYSQLCHCQGLKSRSQELRLHDQQPQNLKEQ